jgi:hypothetical protein
VFLSQVAAPTNGIRRTLEDGVAELRVIMPGIKDDALE